MGENTPYLHSAQDTVDKMDFSHAQEVSRVALGFAIEIGYVNDDAAEKLSKIAEK